MSTIILQKPTADTAVGLTLKSLKNGGPVTVDAVGEGSLSAASGLTPGMKVVTINGEAVTSAVQGTDRLKAAVGAVEIFVEAAATAAAVALPAALMEQHIVAFARTPGDCGECDAQMQPPPYTAWFQSRGVAQADFDVLMSDVVQPINAYAKKVPCYVFVTLVSCGLCGWECQLCEGAAIPGTVQALLNAFNDKYPNVKGEMSRAPPGLVFSAPPLEQQTAVPVVAAQVMERAEAPEVQVERLAKLKSMLDRGLISQAEYDDKKAEILAAL